jgi:hypothetical protein
MNQRYEIIIRGHLSSQWTEVFDGMLVACQEDGNTHIISDLPDQSALYGLLMRLRDLGMTLISVNSVEHVIAKKSNENLDKSRIIKEEL